MKFSKISATEVDMKKYKSQNMVRRSVESSTMNYNSISITTDADVDG